MEIVKHGGRGVWNGQRNIQRRRAGLFMGQESTLHHWHGHFETVLKTHKL